MKVISALLLVVVITLTACDKVPQASGPEPICQELDATIDASIRKVALILTEGEAYPGSLSAHHQDLERRSRGIDASDAVQQPANYLSANNHLQVIRINLELQSQHKCPIRKSVISPLMYSKNDVIKCQFAIKSKNAESSTLCDIKNWKGIEK